MSGFVGSSVIERRALQICRARDGPSAKIYNPTHLIFFVGTIVKLAICQTDPPHPPSNHSPPTAMGVKKSTKKFEKNKLGKVLDQRKAQAKTKALHALHEKRKKKRKVESGRDGSDGEEDGEEAQEKVMGDKVGIKAFEGMSVDDFLGGGFEVPEVNEKSKGNSKKEEKGAGKKRKRTADGEDKEDESDVEDVASAAGLGDDDDAGDEFEQHKAEIAGLAEQDPEFYKYLQENDSELLNFDDLEGIDELSEGDDSDEDSSKKKKKKKKQKKKKAADSDDEDEVDEDEEEEESRAEEVTKAHVAKWRKALVEENSLRALRKVVLAFRAAVHIHDERNESHAFKYSITNPDGTVPPTSTTLRNSDTNLTQCTTTS